MKTLVGMLLALVACGTPLDDTSIVSGPDPFRVDPHPIPLAPEPILPLDDIVLEFSEGDSVGPHTLSVPVAVFLQPGEERSARLVLTAGAGPRSFDIVVGQKDSTAAVFDGLPIVYTRGLVLADETGLLANNVVVVPYTFEFGSPGSYAFDLPFRGKAAGRSLVHVIWTFGDGTKLGLATIDVQVN